MSPNTSVRKGKLWDTSSNTTTQSEAPETELHYWSNVRSSEVTADVDWLESSGYEAPLHRARAEVQGESLVRLPLVHKHYCATCSRFGALNSMGRCYTCSGDVIKEWLVRIFQSPSYGSLDSTWHLNVNLKI